MPYADPEARKAYNRAYRLRNLERLHEQKRAKRHAEPERVRAMDHAAYLRKDKERIRANGRRHYQKNKEVIAVKKRAYHQEQYQKPEIKARQLAYSQKYKQDHLEESKVVRQRYRINHREEILAKAKAFRLAHPEIHQARNYARRARKRNAPQNDFTGAQWIEMKEAYGHRCVYCTRKMKRLTQDHITPLIHGGSHTAINIVPACAFCNSKKRDKAPLIAVQPLLLMLAPAKKVR